MKKTYFVCTSYIQDQMVVELIESLEEESAIHIFKTKYNIAPNKILGPFFKKRPKSKRKFKNLKYSDIYYKASYNGWEVSVNELKDPVNYCTITFNKKIDQTSNYIPKNESEIIPIINLKRV